jgi:hypothetical protein
MSSKMINFAPEKMIINEMNKTHKIHNQKRLYFITCTVLCFLCLIMPYSCTQLLPAGFWKNYQPQLIREKESDQGPWGRYRKIVWESNKIHPFDKGNIIDYSHSNGWLLTDSVLFSIEYWCTAQRRKQPEHYVQWRLKFTL